MACRWTIGNVSGGWSVEYHDIGLLAGSEGPAVAESEGQGAPASGRPDGLIDGEAHLYHCKGDHEAHRLHEGSAGIAVCGEADRAAGFPEHRAGRLLRAQ